MEARALPALLVLVIVCLGACQDTVGVEVEPGDPGDAAVEVVMDGLRDPVLAVHAPDDSTRLFIVEKPGLVRVIRDGVLLPNPFLDIADVTSDGGERGLLGLAFHPEYPSNGWFFVNHTDPGGDTRILRFTVSADADRADRASEVVVLTVPQPYTNHNGGHLAFGPDGMLYIGMGDGGSGGDPDGNGQDPSTLLGSMLRIDVDALPYSIPGDNPFVGAPASAPETWAWGLRNPWRWSFDRLTGDLWIADVGQNRFEEISVQPAGSGGGENYGWNLLEGSACYATEPCDPSGTVLPVHEYGRDDGCSVTGGVVYRGTDVPALEGRYLFADYCGGWIRSFVLRDGIATDLVDHTSGFGEIPAVVSFGEDPAGEVYVVSLEGTVYRIVPGS